MIGKMCQQSRPAASSSKFVELTLFYEDGDFTDRCLPINFIQECKMNGVGMELEVFDRGDARFGKELWIGIKDFLLNGG